MADITKRGFDCEDEGERGKRDTKVHVDPKTLAGNGSKKHPLNVIGLPGQQPFVNQDLFIYARKGGSDKHGKGTIDEPYATMQRCLLDIPSVIPSGTIYHVDITGIGMETLPHQWECPVFVASEGVGDFDFSQPIFYYYAAVNITADPQPATGVSGITSVPLAGAVISVPTPSTSLIAIQSPGAGWTPDQLKGKFCMSSGAATEHSVIWHNTNDTIYLTTPFVPTFPLTIAEPSAGLQSTKDPGDLHRAAVNFRNTVIMLGGLKIQSLSAADGPFGGWGLQMAGTTPPMALQLCDITGGGNVAESWVRTRQCHLKDVLFLDAPLAMNQTYVDGSLEVVPSGPRVSMLPGARGMDSLIRNCVIEKTVPIHPRDLFDTFSSAPVPLLVLQNVQILDTIPEFPPNGQEAGSLDGILWTGVMLQLWGVDITRRPTDPNFGSGTALHLKGNGANVTLRGVTGSGYALGAFFENGSNGELDDAALGIPTTLSGTGGVQQTGSNAVAAWPAAIYPAAGSNITDYVAAAAQGSRLWRRS